MGRAKRIAESRNKEILDKKTSESPRTEASPAGSVTTAVPSTYMSTGRALWHILLLFIVPAILLVIIGKLLFRL